jgi:rare lipoprotein A
MFLILPSFLFFTGCSQKSYDSDYERFYKDTKNPKINNSREMHKYTMRPYTVFGIKYYPFIANIGDEFEGVASWYGPDFHSKKTSNGEIYDMYDMTAAHKTLPMNTVVKVDNQENGRSIVVRINDRGPFVNGRIIDLSNKAARDINMIAKGTAKVKLTVLGYNGEIENKDAPYSALSESSESSSSSKSGKSDVLEPMDIKEDSVVSKKFTPTSNKLTKTGPNSFTNSTSSVSTSSNNQKALPNGKFGVQVGAFSQEDGALKVKNDIQKKFANNRVDIKKVLINDKTFFKVFISGFESYESAQTFKNANGLSSSVISSD